MRIYELSIDLDVPSQLLLRELNYKEGTQSSQLREGDEAYLREIFSNKFVYYLKEQDSGGNVIYAWRYTDAKEAAAEWTRRVTDHNIARYTYILQQALEYPKTAGLGG